MKTYEDLMWRAYSLNDAYNRNSRRVPYADRTRGTWDAIKRVGRLVARARKVA